MKLYAIRKDMGRQIPGRWTLGYIEDAAGDELPLSDGVRFAGSHVEGSVIAGSEPTDYTEAGSGAPVLRERLAKAIADIVGFRVELIL